MKNLAGLMKQASQMQSKMAEMQAKLDAAEVEGESGAGMVRITLTGKSDLKRMKIDPKLLDPAEAEMLEDLIVAAHADAKRKVEAIMADEMKNATGVLERPGGMQLPFCSGTASRTARPGHGWPRSRSADRPAGQAARPGSAQCAPCGAAHVAAARDPHGSARRRHHSGGASGPHLLGLRQPR